MKIYFGRLVWRFISTPRRAWHCYWEHTWLLACKYFSLCCGHQWITFPILQKALLLWFLWKFKSTQYNPLWSTENIRLCSLMGKLESESDTKTKKIIFDVFFHLVPCLTWGIKQLRDLLLHFGIFFYLENRSLNWGMGAITFFFFFF